jgi:uncharacterized protein (TIGR04222 family)
MWAAMLVAARRWIRRAVFEGMWTDEIPDLDWAELAFLGGGPQRVFEAATVCYVQSGYGAYNSRSAHIIVVNPLPADVHPAVKILQAGLQPGVNAYLIGVRIADRYAAYFEYLERRKLAVRLGRRVVRAFFAIAQFFVSLIFFAASMSLCFGYFGDPMPVDSPGYAGTIAAAIGGAVLFTFSFLLMASSTLLSRRISRWGYGVLAAYQKRQWPDRRFFEIFGPVPGTENNLALAVALFGLLVLRHTPLAHMMQGLYPPND